MLLTDMVYLDNGSTTPVCPEAAKAAEEALKNFANPSSLYGMGVDAKRRVCESARTIEEIVNAGEGTFYFTSGATEANNWAVFGVAKNGRAKHVITVKTEHPSVLEPFAMLEKSGVDVEYIGVDKCGNVDTDALLAAIRKDTVLVSVMHVNNETGTISDISAIGNEIKRINKDTVFHVDGVCSFCKIPVDVQAARIDSFSVSGHKLHAPKGIGGLYVRKGTRIAPFIVGGGQQQGMRSGTENTVFIEAFAAAAKVCARDLGESAERVRKLKQMLANGVLHLGGEINGETDAAKSSPYVLNAGFRGMKSQVIINALEERGIYASAGSACSSNKGRAALSGVLSAMGIERGFIEGAVRFSFSRFSTEEDVRVCVAALTDIVKKYGGINV